LIRCPPSVIETDGQEFQLEVELSRELMGHLHIEADQLPIAVEKRDGQSSIM